MPKPFNYRFESFGGIVALDRPPALVFLDREGMEALRLGSSEKWKTESAFLSAPTEVHFAVTNRCSSGCTHCYQSSGAPLPSELGFEKLLEGFQHLADMGVFHVALGGGESTEVPWLLDLAREVRALGIIPNLTTNGTNVTEEFARASIVFGQINVSLDGVGEQYAVHRGVNRFEEAVRGLKLLRKHHKRVGINCVVSRKNFDHLEEVVRLARKVRCNEVEFLRLKPAGRGREHYVGNRLSPEQGREMFPLVVRLIKRYRISLKLDCSFTPFVCAHSPDVEWMERFAIFGCEGGNILMGITPEGQVSPCSFEKTTEGTVFDLKDRWSQEDTFQAYRTWTADAPEPCRSCTYLSLCKGGCHVVSHFLSGDRHQPDPECPKVIAHRASCSQTPLRLP